MRGPHSSTVGGGAGAGAASVPASGGKQKTLGAFFAKSAAKEGDAAAAAAPPAAAAGEWGAAGAPLRVSFGLGPTGAHAAEGRTITLEVRRSIAAVRRLLLG